MDTISPVKPVDAAVADYVRSHLHSLLGKFGLERVDVAPGEDYEGDPLINIDAYFRLSRRPIDLRATRKAQIDLYGKLMELGEHRFPFLRFHFHEKQKVAGERH